MRARATAQVLLASSLALAACGGDGASGDRDGDGLPGAVDPCPKVANALLFAEKFDGTTPDWSTDGGQWHIGPTMLFESATIEPDGAIAWPAMTAVGDAFVDAPMRATDVGDVTSSFGPLLRVSPGDPPRPYYECLLEGDDAAAKLVIARRTRGGLRQVLGEASAPALVLGAFTSFRFSAQGGRLRCQIAPGLASIATPTATVAATDPAPLPDGVVGLEFIDARGETESVDVHALPAACALP